MQIQKITRMVDALLAQAKSNAELASGLGGKLDVFGERLEHITRSLELFLERQHYTPVEGVPIIAETTPSELRRRRDREREETPVTAETPSERRKRLAAPRGYRPPKAGGYND